MAYEDDEWLVDEILPANEFHIIAGPSGSGKTRVVLELIRDWKAGRDVFGHKSYPLPCVYACRDRGLKNLHKTMRSLGIGEDDLDILSLLDTVTYKDVRDDVEKFVRAVRATIPDLRVLFIDGLAMMAPAGFRGNDYQTVAKYACMISRLCHELGITIVAIMHSPKTHEGEGYLNPRQRVSGSVAWAAVAETILILEPEEGQGADKARRILTVLPRNAAEETHLLRFNSTGSLEPDLTEPSSHPGEPKMGRPADASGEIFLWYSSLEPEREFPYAEYLAACLKRGVSKSTADRWLRDHVVACKVDKIGPGMYRKPDRTVSAEEITAELGVSLEEFDRFLTEKLATGELQQVGPNRFRKARKN